ncbi:hypothetical protein AB0C76_32990 [Kitasatospora sp. NPDC048722]|uniref:hypothetical protein n=1 Tax=Kitasatospora sp. NPDC048722 TaxID=3155639 RepID=UPI0033F0695D
MYSPIQAHAKGKTTVNRYELTEGVSTLIGHYLDNVEPEEYDTDDLAEQILAALERAGVPVPADD